MGAGVMPQPERARTWADRDDDSLEDLVARVPTDLVLAQDGRAEGGAGLDELEHDFWIDPCHFLRRACQVADYGGTSGTPALESARAAE